MKLFESIKNLFNANSDSTVKPQDRVKLPCPPSADVKLSINKVAAQLALIQRSYALKVWDDEGHREKWQHDLELMLAHADLRSVNLELLDAREIVAHEFVFEFTGQSLQHTRGFDLAGGMELPVLKLAKVKGQRLLVYRNNRESIYRAALQLPWADAKVLPRKNSSDFASEHSARITGGRLTGRMRVGTDARQRIVVTQTGTKGYAFGKARDLEDAQVYLNSRYAPEGFVFKVGRCVSGVVVQTPRGLQARDIQPFAA